ncbi:MAG: glucose-6-phosphate isomerase [Alphaproteobacteria bacterium]|nr:glucose-6-phosphate isomerase [Alphaproteobacteria bacterium]
MDTPFDLDKKFFLDISRHGNALQLLPSFLRKIEAQDFSTWRDKLFSGEVVNNTENRPALHVQIRAPESRKSYDPLKKFSDKIRQEKKYTDIVNIGIGGSDLGPAMIYKALEPQRDGPRSHYVSNLDASHIQQTLAALNHETTFFLIASKTFTTMETLENAKRALAWQPDKSHYAALTANKDEAQRFGIGAENIFSFPEGIGGRYSVWSSIGLSLCISFGSEVFSNLLDGAHGMDRHFAEAPLEENMPVLAAMLGQYHLLHGRQAHAVLPYAENLGRLPAYLQQLIMESNGKKKTREGVALKSSPCAIIFGEAGTNAQHSFMQFIHESPATVPVDFIGIISPRQNGLMANMLAQAQALESNGRPSSIILLQELNAFCLGMLLAFYEHRTFTEAVFCSINPFDQPGVEMGKKIAKELSPALEKQGDLTEPHKNLDSLLKILDN